MSVKNKRKQKRNFKVDIEILFLFLQGPLYDWVRYHRIHHKYYNTDKDPYLSNKGFWYSYFISHIMNSNLNKEELNKLVDMRDIDNDSYVVIQRS